MTTGNNGRVGGEEYDTDRAADAVERERAKVAVRNRNRGQLLAYVLIVSIAVWGFWQQDKDEYERCMSGNEIRQVSRNVVLAVYDLGISLSQPPPGPLKGGKPVELTPEEQEDQEVFVQRLNEFRDKNLAKVPGDRVCEDGLF